MCHVSFRTCLTISSCRCLTQYLDTQRNADLTLYLEALHRGGHASADHTTLLINCYTNLRLTQQLDQFIQVCTGE